MNIENFNEIWQKNHWGLYEGDTHGVVGFGGMLTPQRLKEAYSVGVFPWPQNNDLVWFCPENRGVLFFNEFKVHKRLKRKFKNATYTYSINKAFSQVIKECAKAPRRGQDGTWITKDLIKAYEKLYDAGSVLSFECWNDEALVGGLYGVATFENKKLKYFSGESVFGLESDVAKLCFINCVEYLQSNGLKWLDIQMVTKLTEDFGGRYISRNEFINLLF